MSASPRARILIVEDEASIATVVAKRLVTAGFAASHASNGEDGLAMARSGEFDLILLDIHLPILSGFEVLEALRKEGRRTPIFIVSADRLIDDRVKGLRMGADDYLVKPFDFDELLARIEVILRRSSTAAQQTLEVGPLMLDLEHHRVTRSGQAVDVSSLEFRLLEYLVRHANASVGRVELAKAIWGHENYSRSNVIDVYMGYLREAVDGSSTTRLILDTPDGGFLLKV